VLTKLEIRSWGSDWWKPDEESLVTKKEIVKEIAERAGETQLKTKQIVQWTFEAIIKTLETEGRIELRNFGVFEVKRRKSRKARNPKTDEPVEVPAKNVVTFQPGKVMEIKVQSAQVHVPKKKKPRKGKKKKIAKPKPGSTPEVDTNETVDPMPPPID
jgi:nucleoid DNA-binding protein